MSQALKVKDAANAEYSAWFFLNLSCQERVWQDCATITGVCMTCVVWEHGVVHCSERACLSASLRQRHIAGQDSSVAM